MIEILTLITLWCEPPVYYSRLTTKEVNACRTQLSTCLKLDHYTNRADTIRECFIKQKLP